MRAFSSAEPSHQTTRDGRVWRATSSTQRSALVMGKNFILGRASRGCQTGNATPSARKATSPTGGQRTAVSPYARRRRESGSAHNVDTLFGLGAHHSVIGLTLLVSCLATVALHCAESGATKQRGRSHAGD